MRLFLNPDLCKSDTPSPRQGTYVGRVQTSVGADGTPIYKYFYDPKEYEQYMKNKRSGDGKDGGEPPEKDKEEDKGDPKNLKDKVGDENKESKKKIDSPPGAKAKEEKDKVEKSLLLWIPRDVDLYVRIDK